ncbi:MAG: hypothetical protein AB9835_01170 [Eubacteriales bacterium]
MTGKLIKYDFRQSGAKYVMSFAIMAGLFVSTALLSLFNISLINSLLFIMCCVVSIGLLFIYIIFSISDFYKTMSGRGSYFTYMLPVSVNKVLLSKFITVVTWGAGIIITEILFWLGLDKLLLGKMGLNFAPLFETIGQNSELVGYTVMMLVIQYLGTIMLIAFCISLTSVPRFRNSGSGVAVGIVGYFVLNNVISLLIAGIVFGTAFFKGNLQQIMNDNMSPEYTLTFMKDMGLILAILYAVLIPLFWYLTSFIYKKHRTV